MVQLETNLIPHTCL